MAIQARRHAVRKRSLVGFQRELFHDKRFGAVTFFRRVWETGRIDEHLQRPAIAKRR